MWHLSTKGFSFPLEKASNVNFLWFGTQPALSTAAGLQVLVVEGFDRKSGFFLGGVLLERGWSMGLMPLLLQALLFSIRFHFV